MIFMVMVASPYPRWNTQAVQVLATLGPKLAAVLGALVASFSPAARPASAPVSARPRATAAAPGPLTGKVIGIDPGHNGRNYTDPAFLDHLIWNGRAREACDTTGTQTDAGYTEARFNWNVAGYLAAELRAAGAKVVLTRHSNDGIGPCVDQRARIIDRAHAAVAIDIHGDGGPAGGRGFAILEPVADGPNHRVIGASERFARILRASFRSDTGMPYSTYDGSYGLVKRDDLAGLNLTTVPKVLIECGNMRNATDARWLSSPAWQRRAAEAMFGAISTFVRRSRT
jgi:N-acetylmuramoyl-L-alanine amidase